MSKGGITKDAGGYTVLPHKVGDSRGDGSPIGTCAFDIGPDAVEICRQCFAASDH